MKKALILIFALFIAFSSHARIGVVGGFTSSSSDLQSAYLNIKSISQYHFGLTYKMDLGNVIDVQPSLIYNVKGTNLSNATNDISDFDVDFKTGFIELPVQLQAGFSIGELARVYGLVEPFVGYAVSHMIEGNWYKGYDTTWDFIKSRLEYGVGLGAGVDLFHNLQFNLTYFWNFGELYGVDLGEVQEALSGKANGIQLSLAVLF